MNPQEIKLEDQSSERLALLLNQQYNTIMLSQQNILAINSVLQNREQQYANAGNNPTVNSANPITEVEAGNPG